MCDLTTYPSGPALRTKRSRSRPSMSTLTPRLISPRTLACGTKTSSNISSPVLEPLIPSLSSFLAHENPLNDFSTTKAVMPLDPLLGSVLAYTTIKSASGPCKFLIHVNTQCTNHDSIQSLFHRIGFQRAKRRRTFVIHIFVPLSTQPPSTGFAEVFMLTTSDPAECSDMASAPILSPDIRPGRNCAFCSAEPFRES